MRLRQCLMASALILLLTVSHAVAADSLKGHSPQANHSPDGEPYTSSWPDSSLLLVQKFPSPGMKPSGPKPPGGGGIKPPMTKPPAPKSPNSSKVGGGSVKSQPNIKLGKKGTLTPIFKKSAGGSPAKAKGVSSGSKGLDIKLGKKGTLTPIFKKSAGAK